MADQRIQYTEQMVGAGHPSLSDTLNRLALVEHDTDGTHKAAARTTLGLATTDGPTFDHVHLTSGQVGFPGAAVPSADANTLDDYEEGAWTPGVAFGGGTTGATYNAAATVGYYTRVGNIVHVSGLCVLTAKGSSSGDATITGLPFATANNNAAAIGCAVRAQYMTFANQFQAAIAPNSTTIALSEIAEAGVVGTITDADFADNTSFYISATYRAA